MLTCPTRTDGVSIKTSTSGNRLCLLLVLFITVQAFGASKVLPYARVGKPYEYAVVYQGLVEPVQSQWMGLPKWLKGDGPRLHGTPDAVTSAPAEFSVTLTGQLGSQLEGRFVLEVRPSIRSLVMTKSTLPPLAVGAPVNIMFAAGGGEGKLSWEAHWIARIAGLDIQTDAGAGTCRLIGTPTAEGDFFVQVIVHDETGASDRHGFHGQTRAVAAPLRIATTTLPKAVFGYPYVASFVAEGGRPPYDWKVQWQGSTPPGLETVKGEGKIVGTATCLGEYPLVVILKDAFGTRRQMTGKLVTIPPNCAPSLIQQELPAGTVGSAYDTTLCASGLVADVKWTVAGAPSWLHWETIGQAACRFSGMPVEKGTWDITVALLVTAPSQTLSRESAREIGKVSRVFKLSISPKDVPPLQFIDLHPPVAVQNLPYRFRFATEGGEPPVTLRFSEGLPDALTVTSNGTIHTKGMPEPEVIEFTVTAASEDGQTAKMDSELRVVTVERSLPLELSKVTRLNGLLLQESVFPVPVHGGVPPYTASIEPSSGIEVLPCEAQDSVAFRLCRPFGTKAKISVHDSAGRRVTRSVVVYPSILLGHAILAVLGVGLLVYLATVLHLKYKAYKLRKQARSKGPSKTAAQTEAHCGAKGHGHKRGSKKR